MIKNLRKASDGRWTWEANGVESATNKAGNGIFTVDEYGFYNRQLVGTCDFTACRTVSGMRRKLKNLYKEEEE